MSARSDARRRERKNRERGFTLVELMVALTGGLFISLAVFALARDSGRFYQREARIANATVGALLGFERLRTDLSRAGFMSSANVNRDPAVCGTPSQGNWPLNLRNLAAIQLNTPAVPTPILVANGRNPPEILLAGAFSSSDSFAAKIPSTGATTRFNLEPSQPALLRLGNGNNPDTATLQGAFPSNRGLRVVQNGRVFYGQIIGAVGGAAPYVTINAQPALQMHETSPLGACGLSQIGSGVSVPMINVVNFIHYDLRNMNNAQTAEGKTTYTSLYSNSATGPGESTRTELVRVEQDVSGTAIANTEEVVAEYAVDLQISSLTAVTGCCDPTIGLFAPGSAQFATFTGPTFGTGNTPELIRSVRVRLGVRSREGDRANTVASGANAGLFRFNLGTGGAGTTDTFARVRTFQADILLHNQADVTW